MGRYSSPASGLDLRKGGRKGKVRSKASILGGLARDLAASLGPRDTPYAKYRDDPVGFARDVLGVDLWGMEHSRSGKMPGQREIAEALVEHQDVAVQSGRNTGKTFLAAVLAVWWLNTRVDSLVLTTAPTAAQVWDLLWREIRALYSNSLQPLLGRIGKDRIEVSDRWYALGRSTDKPERLLGYHAPGGEFFIGDEASGLDEDTFGVAAGVATKATGRRLYIGNPTKRGGGFHEACSSSTSTFKVFRLNSEDAPAEFNGVGMISDKWISDRRLEWGPDWARHPLYQAFVQGLFPSTSSLALIPIHLLERCADLHFESGGRYIGLDVAREGSDECIAVLLDNMRVIGADRWGKRDLMYTARRTMALAEKWKVDPRHVKVDVTGGYGGGVVDRMREAKFMAEGVNFSSKPANDWRHVTGRTTRFKNRRAELYYACARLLEDEQLSIPERYRELWGDLTAIEWAPDKGEGKVQLAKKDQVKAILGRSPDWGDALICALARTDSVVRVRSLTPRSEKRRARRGGAARALRRRAKKKSEAA